MSFWAISTLVVAWKGEEILTNCSQRTKPLNISINSYLSDQSLFHGNATYLSLLISYIYKTVTTSAVVLPAVLPCITTQVQITFFSKFLDWTNFFSNSSSMIPGLARCSFYFRPKGRTERLREPPLLHQVSALYLIIGQRITVQDSVSTDGWFCVRWNCELGNWYGLRYEGLKMVYFKNVTQDL